MKTLLTALVATAAMIAGTVGAQAYPYHHHHFFHHYYGHHHYYHHHHY